MSDRFIKGNTYVFSFKKMKKDMRKTSTEIRYFKKINGQEVRREWLHNKGYSIDWGATKSGQMISIDWCKCIKVGDR